MRIWRPPKIHDSPEPRLSCSATEDRMSQWMPVSRLHQPEWRERGQDYSQGVRVSPNDEARSSQRDKGHSTSQPLDLQSRKHPKHAGISLNVGWASTCCPSAALCLFLGRNSKTKAVMRVKFRISITCAPPTLSLLTPHSSCLPRWLRQTAPRPLLGTRSGFGTKLANKNRESTTKELTKD